MIIEALIKRKISVSILSTEGATTPIDTVELITTSGIFEKPCQDQPRTSQATHIKNSVVHNQWQWVQAHEGRYDFMINLGYDVLPLSLTEHLKTPLYHIISMQSLNDELDWWIKHLHHKAPNRLAFHSKNQAQTYQINDAANIIYNGFHKAKYRSWESPDHCIGWASRIAPEKGLEDALAVAQSLNIPLKVWGQPCHENYYRSILSNDNSLLIKWQGFLEHQEFRQHLGNCKVMLATPKWDEALGHVVIESILSGVPVCAYARGGITEIIQNDLNGYLVKPNDIHSLADRTKQALNLNRKLCRDSLDTQFGFEHYCQRLYNFLGISPT